MRKKNSILIIIWIAMMAPVAAQNLLSLDDAIQIGLKNNYDIQIARQEDYININNVFAGNAGMLPIVSLNGSVIKSLNNTKLEYSTGETVDQKNARSAYSNAYAEFDWTLFDGLKMFASYNQLKSIRDQSADNLKTQVQQSVSQIMTAYYNVWYQKKLLTLLQVTDSISSVRLKSSEQRFNVGLGSKLELLQAQVDHNADRSELMRQEVELGNARRSLNQLLARDINTEFEVNDALPQTTIESEETIRQKVISQNPQLLAADKQREVSLFEMKKQKANYFPRVTLVGDYTFTKSTAEASFVQLNQIFGPSAGLAATWTLFNGSVVRHATENSKINLLISDLEYSKLKSQLEQQTEDAYHVYQNNIQLQQLESENQSSSKQYLDLAFQKYQTGGISGLDFQDAKQSYVDAQTRLYDAMYNTELSELTLLQLSGELIK